MAAVSNCEISEVHKMQLEITIGNMPRHHSNCACKKHIYIFNDNNIVKSDTFYSLADLLNRTPSRLLWEVFNEAAINARNAFAPKYPPLTHSQS